MGRNALAKVNWSSFRRHIVCWPNQFRITLSRFKRKCRIALFTSSWVIWRWILSGSRRLHQNTALIFNLALSHMDHVVVTTVPIKFITNSTVTMRRKRFRKVSGKPN